MSGVLEQVFVCSRSSALLAYNGQVIILFLAGRCMRLSFSSSQTRFVKQLCSSGKYWRLSLSSSQTQLMLKQNYQIEIAKVGMCSCVAGGCGGVWICLMQPLTYVECRHVGG